MFVLLTFHICPRLTPELGEHLLYSTSRAVPLSLYLSIILARISHPPPSGQLRRHFDNRLHFQRQQLQFLTLSVNRAEAKC